MTERKLDSIEPPSSGRDEYRDTEVRGLVLRVTATGAQSWTYQYRHEGRNQRVTIGGYPAIDLKTARSRGSVIAGQVAGGKNPAALSEVSTREWRDGVEYVPQEMVLFHSSIYENVTMGDHEITRDQVRKALEDAGAWEFVSRYDEGIDRVMDAHSLDAIVAPTGGPAWVTDLVNGDHFGGGSSGFAAVAGYPNITVPAGYVFGLPVGLSFFGRAWSEPTLIRLAYAFEQATLHRRPPGFLPTVFS